MLDRSKVREIYAHAAALPKAQRDAYLTQACGPDQPLRAEVESLLAATDNEPDFMAAPTKGGSGSAATDALGTRIGPYKLLEEIGRGGFGTVYLAEQDHPVRRRVALKIIKLGMDTQAVVSRFEAERQALAMMDHAHIAKVFDAGITDPQQGSRPYFVMELVRGEPITTYADHAGLTIPERLDLFIQVCQALQHAHSKGIIHRDIKPGNVLVTTQDGRPHAKVIDFGIAKATEQRLTERTFFTEFRQLIGTPEYMSPEQAGGAPDVDTRSDVYSLGVLLYELLTGATPFEPGALRAAAYDEIQRIIREVEPPKPSTRLSRLATLANVAALRKTEPARLGALVTGDLDWIVMKALDKDRARRYETASALAADLSRHLVGEPVSAAPPSAVYRVRKFLSRHRLAATVASLFLTTLVLGIIGTSVGLVAANRASAAALKNADRAAFEAEQARAINEFMREVLTSVEPQKGGADVRLVDVLVNASTSASQRFAGHPLLEAQVQDLLAAVYSKIGQMGQAKAASQRALTLYQTHVGPDDPQALRAEARAVGSVINLNQTDEGERMVNALLPRAERVLGPDDVTTLEVRRGLATVHLLRGRLDEAEGIFLALRGHPRLADDDRVLSRILFSLCRLRQRRPAEQDDTQRSAALLHTVELAQECVERSQRASGPGSADTLRARVLLAQLLCDADRLHEAERLCRVILAESAAKFEECHVSRRTAMSVLADVMAGLGAFHESADLYRRIIECARAHQSSDVMTFMASLGDGLKFFDRSGRAAEGEALAREGLATLSQFGGAHESVSLKFESYVAHFVSMSGRAAEAEPLFAGLLAREQSMPGTHLKTRLHRFYAAHLVRRGSFEQAEAHLQQAASIRGKELPGSSERLFDEVLCGFIDLYTAWKRLDKVSEYEQLREKALGISPRL